MKCQKLLGTEKKKQMWIFLSYIDPSNRNKKYRLWNKASSLCSIHMCVYDCLFGFFMFLFINQLYNLGLNLSFVFNLLQGTAQGAAVLWADWEMSHSHSIILGLPAAGVSGNTGQQISSTN